MPAAIKVKMGSSEKKKKRRKGTHVTFPLILVFHVVVMQNNGKEMYKKCASRAKSE